jgi:hypothetical protein
MSKGRTLAKGGAERSVTITFGYPDRLRSLVAGSIRLGLVLAEARWGRWQTIESISTPDTIYADLTGRTKAQHTPGVPRGPLTVESKLLAIGYRPAPGEVGTLRYFRSELGSHLRPRKRAVRKTPTATDDEFGDGN